jgi:hypothetical protein
VLHLALDGGVPRLVDVLEELLAEPAQRLLMRLALQALHELAEPLDRSWTPSLRASSSSVSAHRPRRHPSRRRRRLLQLLEMCRERVEVRDGHVVDALDRARGVARGQDLDVDVELHCLELARGQELEELVGLALVELAPPGAVRLLLHRDVAEEIHALLERRAPVGDLASLAASARAVLEVVVSGERLELGEALEAPDVADRGDEPRGDQRSAALDGLEDLGVDLVGRLGVASLLAAREQLLDGLLLRLEAVEDGRAEAVALEKRVHDDRDGLLGRALGKLSSLELLPDHREEVLALGLVDLAAEHVLEHELEHAVVHRVVGGIRLHLPLECELDEGLVAVRGEDAEVRALRALVRALVRAPRDREAHEREILVRQLVEAAVAVLGEREEGERPLLARGQDVARLRRRRLLVLADDAGGLDDLSRLLLVEEEARVAQDRGAVCVRGKCEPVGWSAELEEDAVALLDLLEERLLLLALGRRRGVVLETLDDGLARLRIADHQERDALGSVGHAVVGHDMPFKGAC